MMWGNNYYDYGYPMMGYGYGSPWVHILFIVIWALVLATIVIALIRFARGGKGLYHLRHGLNTNAALDILKERYAKGEIERAEFEEKKKDLS